MQSDEKSVCVICITDLISTSLAPIKNYFFAIVLLVTSIVNLFSVNAYLLAVSAEALKLNCAVGCCK